MAIPWSIIGPAAATFITLASGCMDTLAAAQEQSPSPWPDNEPLGMTTIVSVDGSSKNWRAFRQGGAWSDDQRVTVVDDPASKHGKAIEKRFFAGDQSGWNGLTHAGRGLGAFEELYFRIVFRLSPNWQWHKAGGKYFYYGAAGRKGAGPVQFILGWQGDGTSFWSAAGNGRHVANDGPKITRDEYHTIEIHHVASTSDANGSMRMWVDGVGVQSFNVLGDRSRNAVQPVNQEWRATRDLADKRLGGGLQAFMFWGGQNDTKSVNDWVRLSELYISGKQD